MSIKTKGQGIFINSYIFHLPTTPNLDSTVTKSIQQNMSSITTVQTSYNFQSDLHEIQTILINIINS